jgi:hypothetical protein
LHPPRGCGCGCGGGGIGCGGDDASLEGGDAAASVKEEEEEEDDEDVEPKEEMEKEEERCAGRGSRGADITARSWSGIAMVSAARGEDTGGPGAGAETLGMGGRRGGGYNSMEERRPRRWLVVGDRGAPRPRPPVLRRRRRPDNKKKTKTERGKVNKGSRVGPGAQGRFNGYS